MGSHPDHASRIMSRRRATARSHLQGHWADRRRSSIPGSAAGEGRYKVGPELKPPLLSSSLFSSFIDVRKRKRDCVLLVRACLLPPTSGAFGALEAADARRLTSAHAHTGRLWPMPAWGASLCLRLGGRPAVDLLSFPRWTAVLSSDRSRSRPGTTMLPRAQTGPGGDAATTLSHAIRRERQECGASERVHTHPALCALPALWAVVSCPSLSGYYLPEAFLMTCSQKLGPTDARPSHMALPHVCHVRRLAAAAGVVHDPCVDACDAFLVPDGKLIPCGADPSIAAHQTSICRGTGRTIFQLSWGEQKDMREQVSVLLDYQTSRLLSILYNGRRSDPVMHS